METSLEKSDVSPSFPPFFFFASEFDLIKEMIKYKNLRYIF